MADYYSLLARAVAASPQSGPEARQAVYERARKALMNQLRSIQPPVADADIASEGRALDEAIARLELELVKKGSAATQTPGEPAAPPTCATRPLAQFTARSRRRQRPRMLRRRWLRLRLMRNSRITRLRSRRVKSSAPRRRSRHCRVQQAVRVEFSLFWPSSPSSRARWVSPLGSFGSARKSSPI